MAGEIFISYRRADRAWAELLHTQLTAQGTASWYDAHVGAGEDWRLATAKALEDSKIFVLLFSENAAQSSDIAKELAAAVLKKKLIIPVRLENIEPSGPFLYELASRNWINAFENTEARLAELAKGLAHLAQTGVRDENILHLEREDGGWPLPRRVPMHKRTLMATAAAVLAATLALVFWLYPRPQAIIAHPLSKPSGISVAVLPFLNLSPDKDQEFFSDGITEEITSALAKVPGLAVIGRTSAFQFKGENRDMRAIGEALGANNLIEGSVRKAGNQVRITAQLIKATDGTHLWTESYDRKLTDIFAVQESIATAIAGALQVPLGLKRGESLISNRTADTQSYQDYLRAVALFRARKIPEMETTLKAVVARDPGYAPAWALLAKAYGNPVAYNRFVEAIGMGSPQETRRFVQLVYDQLEKAARQAVRLDPRNAMAYDALADLEAHQGNWAAGEDYEKRALALDPNNPDILYSYGYLLAATGRIKEALQVQNHILAQEPFVPVYRQRAADLLWTLGRNDEAIRIGNSVAPNGNFRLRQAKILATQGHYAQAADMILTSRTDFPAPGYAKSAEEAAQLLRSAPAKASTPDSLPALPASLSFVYLFIGAEGRSLDFVEREIDAGYYGGIFRDPWAPPSAALRKTERFKAFVRKARFVEYWRARGWPEYCHPVAVNDFACN